MYRLSSYIAVVLLLLFTRVMVPDALILKLHPHTHTVHSDHSDTHKAQVGQKHKHCPVEDLFDTPFQGTVTLVEATQPAHFTAYTFAYTATHTTSCPAYYLLRGPPIV